MTVKIRDKDWYENKGQLVFKKEVLEEIVENLKIEKCPCCAGPVESKDNFGTNLILGISNRNKIVKYCPKENYIIELESHQYKGGEMGTTLGMRIYTNSKYPQLLADSGFLADIKNKHVDLITK